MIKFVTIFIVLIYMGGEPVYGQNIFPALSKDAKQWTDNLNIAKLSSEQHIRLHWDAYDQEEDYAMLGLLMAYYSVRDYQVRRNSFSEEMVVPLLLTMTKVYEQNNKLVVSTYNGKSNPFELLKKYTFQYKATSVKDIEIWWYTYGKNKKRKEWAIAAFDSVLSDFSDEKRELLKDITRNYSLLFKSKKELQEWWRVHRDNSFESWYLDSIKWAISKIDLPAKYMQLDGKYRKVMSREAYYARLNIYLFINDYTKQKLGIPVEFKEGDKNYDVDLEFLEKYKDPINKWYDENNAKLKVPLVYFWEFSESVPQKNNQEILAY